MHFCTLCGNMYYITVDKNSMLYYCRKCGNKDTVNNQDNIVVSKTRMESDVMTVNNINEYTKMDPTLPRTSSIQCINEKCECHQKDEVKPEIIYIRSNADDLKYTFLCCHCDTTWNNYRI